MISLTLLLVALVVGIYFVSLVVVSTIVYHILPPSSPLARKGDKIVELYAFRDRFENSGAEKTSLFYNAYSLDDARKYAQSRGMDFMSLPCHLRDGIYAVFEEKTGLFRPVHNFGKNSESYNSETLDNIYYFLDNAWFFCREDMEKVKSVIGLFFAYPLAFNASVFFDSRVLPDFFADTCAQLRTQRLQESGFFLRQTFRTDLVATRLREVLCFQREINNVTYVAGIALLPITAILTPLILFVLQPLARKLLGARRLTQAMILADVLAGAADNEHTADMPAEMLFAMIFQPCYSDIGNDNESDRHMIPFKPSSSAGDFIARHQNNKFY